MNWIDKLNSELEERRNRNKTSESKEEAEQRKKEWIASQGGKSSIKQLLDWQKDNNHNIGEIAKVKDNNWKTKIGKSNKGKVRTEEVKEQISQSVKEYNNNLTEDEKIKLYSNDSSSRKSLKVRLEILNSIESKTFTTSEARKACEKYGIGNWKGFLKDERIIKQIYKGTNQNNPSIYEKVKQ
jgi:hypothetical protein